MQADSFGGLGPDRGGGGYFSFKGCSCIPLYCNTFQCSVLHCSSGEQVMDSAKHGCRLSMHCIAVHCIEMQKCSESSAMWNQWTSYWNNAQPNFYWIAQPKLGSNAFESEPPLRQTIKLEEKKTMYWNVGNKQRLFSRSQKKVKEKN